MGLVRTTRVGLGGLGDFTPIADPVAGARALVNAKDDLGAQIELAAARTQGIAAAAPFIAKARDEWRFMRNQIAQAATQIAEIDAMIARGGMVAFNNAASRNPRAANVPSAGGQTLVAKLATLVTAARTSQVATQEALNSALKLVNDPGRQLIVDRTPANVTGTAAAAQISELASRTQQALPVGVFIRPEPAPAPTPAAQQVASTPWQTVSYTGVSEAPTDSPGAAAPVSAAASSSPASPWSWLIPVGAILAFFL